MKMWDDETFNAGVVFFAAVIFFIFGIIFMELNTGIIQISTLDSVCQQLMNDPNATFIESFLVNSEFKCEVTKTRVLNLKTGDE